jgi:hypothetical protein
MDIEDIEGYWKILMDIEGYGWMMMGFILYFLLQKRD